jgi:hypothetical protein
VSPGSLLQDRTHVAGHTAISPDLLVPVALVLRRWPMKTGGVPLGEAVVVQIVMIFHDAGVHPKDHALGNCGERAHTQPMVPHMNLNDMRKRNAMWSCVPAARG